ncbi:hypothetical protein AB0I28_30510 [Phytomonospora sp. NPDC050363]
MTTPAGFDELIHPPTRLALMSMLSATEWAEFVLLRGAEPVSPHPGSA